MRERASRASAGERGIVMLLALIALLLISAVGAAILFMASGESSLVGSQRAAARAFYSAVSGLEEARGRMIRGMPGPTSPTPGPGLNPDPSIGGVSLLPQTVNQVLYILNPAPGEAVNPTSPATPYFDSQLINEVPAPVFLPFQNSVAPGVGTPAALPYKWMRITMKTEFASRQDINLSDVGTPNPPYDQVNPVFYYFSRQYRRADLPATVLPPPWGPPPPAGQVCASITCAMPVYKITALSALPNGVRRMTQYEVVNPPPAGVDTPLFTQGSLVINGSASLFMSGDDRCDPNCNKTLNPAYPVGCRQQPGARSGGNVTLNGNTGTGCPNPNRITGQCCSDNPAASNYDPNCVCKSGSCYPLGKNETFPYNLQEIIQQLIPISRPGRDVVNQWGGTLALDNNNTPGNPNDDFWSGQNVKLGTLPTPWVPPTGTAPTGNYPEITYFDRDTPHPPAARRARGFSSSTATCKSMAVSVTMGL